MKLKVIRINKAKSSKINHSSDRVNFANKKCNGHNSIRGVINKGTPSTASLVLLPSLAILAMFMVVFVGIPMNVYATTYQDDDPHTERPSGSGETTSSTTNTSSSTTFSIEDEKTIGITLSSDAIVLDINPTSSGVFKSKSFTVDVSTNNSAGYSLTMTASSTSLSRTTPVNGTTPTIPTIPTGRTFTEATFENGYWGYKLGSDATYSPMTTEVIPINTTEAAANSSVNTITFASKLDNSIPSGTYGVTLSFVAITNPDPVTYMQNISASKLAELMPNAGDTTTLVDSRDGEEYLIGKGLDGLYWMFDNLRLGSTSQTYTLTPNDTNIASNFTLPKSISSNFGSYTEAQINADYKNTTDDNGWKYGVYYNYCAASAGTASPCGTTLNGSSFETQANLGDVELEIQGIGSDYFICYGQTSEYNGVVKTLDADICPAGWEILPLSDDDRILPTSAEADFRFVAGYYSSYTSARSDDYSNNFQASTYCPYRHDDYDGGGEWYMHSFDHDNIREEYSGGSHKDGYPVRCTFKTE